MKQSESSAQIRSAHRFRLALALLLFALASLVILHVAFGRTWMPPADIARALFDLTDNAGERHIVWNLRLPRVLVAIAAGMMLGLAGAILQTIMRNPLVEPGLIGASSGCVLFVVVWAIYAPASWSAYIGLPFVALCGGILTVGAVYWINGTNGPSGVRLALTGVVATAILQSATSLLLLRNQEGLASILLWNFGSLNGRVWLHWNTIWPWLLVLFAAAMPLARKAGLLQLGDATATGLGLPVNRVRLLLLLLAAALTAASVSVVGAIGFIGLIGPHVAALLVGRSPSRLFPVGALFSGALLATADWVGQSVSLHLPFPGMEHHVMTLPVGAVTTLMGAPFFLYLLRQSSARK